MVEVVCMHPSPSPQFDHHSVVGLSAVEDGTSSSAASGLIGPVGLELRQVSGLNGGVAQPLAAGGVQYENGNGIGFRLEADADGEIVLSPVGTTVRLDDRAVDRPTQVGGATIGIGFAEFRVSQRRPPTDHAPGLPLLDRQPPAEEVVETPPGSITDEELIAAVAIGQRRAVEARRFAWPDPEEIVYQAIANGPRLWSRPVGSELFANVSLASGSLPWRVSLDRPVQVSTRCRGAIARYEVLPAVPLHADLTQGPIGIVGQRPGVLALARQLVLSLTALTPPTDLRLRIQAASRHSDDWSWATPLPHVDPESTDPDRFTITVVDQPGPQGGSTVATGPGVIVLTDDADNLPDCDDVVIVAADGTCTVLDHRRELMTMAACPRGLDLIVAAEAALAVQGVAATTPASVERRTSRFTGVMRTLAATKRPTRTDFRRPPIGLTPLTEGYEAAFF
ncbi:MAG: hypothetical protein ACI8TP_000726 [Acidimicrobiales bacterium]|jgi:hypothetical protein